MHEDGLKGYLITYVGDFLILSDKWIAESLHKWLLEKAGWETDGLSEARPGHPVRFLGMQLQGYEDGHFSLDQEAYVDELVRAYKLGEANRAKIVCPKEILMQETDQVQPFDEQDIKSAQKVAGECLWLCQRTRIDVAFATTVLCSKVSKDPHSAIAIGRRILCYLHHTKDFKLHLKPVEHVAPLRVFTDATFAPQGRHSYGGHVVEVKGVPVLWKASKQQLIALSSAEAELIQAVEGCMYAESLMTILSDLGLQCTSAELCLDNTAAISFVTGAGNQRTRHLKVRRHKVQQLIRSGWKVSHCPGERQKADLLTKVLPSVRMQFLCGLLQLRGDRTSNADDEPAVRAVGGASPSMTAMLALLQVCGCCGESIENKESETGVAIEWPWELAVLTLLIVLSTLFLWEAAGAPCRRTRSEEPQVRAVSVEKERRARKLQGRVSAAIDAVLSESPTGDESQPRERRGRNKCSDRGRASREGSDLPSPTVVYGGINMHLPAPLVPTGPSVSVPSQASVPTGPSPSVPSQASVPTGPNSAKPSQSPLPTAPLQPEPRVTPWPAQHSAGGSGDGFRGTPPDALHPAGFVGTVEHGGLGLQGQAREPRTVVASRSAKSTQTDPVIVLDPSEYVYVSGRGGMCSQGSGLPRASQSFRHTAKSSVSVLPEFLKKDKVAVFVVPT